MKNAIDEYLHYEVNDQNILKGEYSSKLELKNNNLIANDTITYEKGLILKTIHQKLFIEIYMRLLTQVKRYY